MLLIFFLSRIVALKESRKNISLELSFFVAVKMRNPFKSQIVMIALPFFLAANLAST